MSPNNLRLRFSPAFFKLSRTTISQGISLTITLLIAALTFAQQSSTPSQSSPSDDSQVAIAGTAASIAVPAGTRFALVLTQPIQTRYIHRGDDIYAQIVSPVTAGNEVVIPPGTFVQGKVDKIERHGGRGEIRLESMSITFPDGYTIPVPGPMTLVSPDGYAVNYHYHHSTAVRRAYAGMYESSVAKPDRSRQFRKRDRHWRGRGRSRRSCRVNRFAGEQPQFLYRRRFARRDALATSVDAPARRNR